MAQSSKRRASRARSSIVVPTQASPEEDETTPLIKSAFSTTATTRKIKFQDRSKPNYSTNYQDSTDSTSDSSLGRSQQIQMGTSKTLSQKYESLDYDTCENTIFHEEMRVARYAKIFQVGLTRWFVILLIGTFTAFTACGITISIEELSEKKYTLIKDLMDHCVLNDCLIVPYAVWLLLNALPVVIGSILVVYVAPVAAGSGIPVIKCYLNGVKVPEVIRLKTLVIKAIGVVTSVVGGLAVGKEGPMIHCGAVIAAGISQGKSTTFRTDLRCLGKFREDHEKRDFVSAGAAAGVAAAFGAPVGGVLFSLEEGASFWNQALTLRIFFCSMVSAFTLNVVLSEYHGHPLEMSYSGLLNFGKFDNLSYSFYEMLIFILMGGIGGILGALYNALNHKLTVFRMRYITMASLRILEAACVAMGTATVGFLMIYFTNDCQPYRKGSVKHPPQFTCPIGFFSSLGAIWFQTPEESVRSLLHDPVGTWSPSSIAIFFVFYYLLAIWTYGLSISSGLFIPTLLAGAAWGRLIGIFVEHLFGHADWLCPGKFALVGAAAMLGGVTRMTISLTVILIEATGNITFGLPLMLTLMAAKWVGDFFNEGLYDVHIQLSRVPLLGWDAPPLSYNIYASEVMSHPVITFKTVEKVSTIINVLTSTPHNGFPVVDHDIHDDSTDNLQNSLNIKTFGRFRGLILRWQLIVLLQHKAFNETAELATTKLSLSDFRDAYPRYPTIQQVHISPHERQFSVDLRPVMNPSSFIITHAATLPRIFRLFRALGLRHLVVVNDRNQVSGIVTRKDLARFHSWSQFGRIKMEELHISYG